MDFTLPASVQHKVDVQLATGRFARAEDVLNEALDFYAEHQATLGDLQASLDDIRAGCVRPLKEVADEIRMKHGWTL